MVENGKNNHETDFLHRSVSEKLRRRWLDTQLDQDTKLPSLRKLADELDVSTMTVRRALRTLEREGHIYRIAGAGTFLRTTPRPVLGRIALVGSDLTSAFQMAVARTIQQVGQSRGWPIQLLDTHWDVEFESTNIRRLPEIGMTGALLLPPFNDPRMAEALDNLNQSHFPMVLLDTTTPGLQADLATSNHETGAYQATKYLLDHGHRRVLYLTIPLAISSVMSRTIGYERALASAGILPRPEWKATIDIEVHREGHRRGQLWWGGCRSILPLLREVERPLAVLAIDSYAGWGVYEACRELNLRIPEDVSIIAFDDVEITSALSPPMTVIGQRINEIAQAGFDLLESRIDSQPTQSVGRKELRQIIINMDLIERGSVTGVSE